jgi:hypothetical protein
MSWSDNFDLPPGDGPAPSAATTRVLSIPAGPARHHPSSVSMAVGSFTQPWLAPRYAMQPLSEFGRSLKGHSVYVVGVAFSPAGRRLVTVAPTLLRHNVNSSFVVFSPDGGRIARPAVDSVKGTIRVSYFYSSMSWASVKPPDEKRVSAPTPERRGVAGQRQSTRASTSDAYTFGSSSIIRADHKQGGRCRKVQEPPTRSAR